MKALTQNINSAFSQTMHLICKKYHRTPDQTAVYLQFAEGQPYPYLFSEGKEPKRIFFHQMVSGKMLGMGITVQGLFSALYGFKLSCQKQLKRSGLNLLLFTTKNKQAFVSVCDGAEHVKVYQMADIFCKGNLQLMEKLN